MSDHARKADPPDLVGTLVRDLVPVRPVRLARAVAAAVVLQAGVALLAAWLLGARVTGAERLADPKFVALLLALALGAGASAIAMAKLSIPGRSVAPAWRVAVIALPVALAVVIVALSPWGGTWKGLAAVFLEGFGCTRTTLMVAVPSWLAGLLYLRRLGPLEPLSVGLFAGSSALLTAALAVQMACASCDAWHLAVAHYAPIVAGAWVAAVLSPFILSIGRTGVGRSDERP